MLQDRGAAVSFPSLADGGGREEASSSGMDSSAEGYSSVNGQSVDRSSPVGRSAIGSSPVGHSFAVGRSPLDGRPVWSTGHPQLDAALPHGGLPIGTVAEILYTESGAGAMRLAMGIAPTPSLPDSLLPSRLIVLIDSSGDFYPPAAFALGVDPRRLLIVRPPTLREAVWATDQCLRSSAVGVVVAALPRLEPATSRRLQLAARSNRTLGLIVRPARGCQKTFAAVRMLIEGRENGHQVTLIKVREGTPAPNPIPIHLYDEAGDETIPVPVSAVSADRTADHVRDRTGDFACDPGADAVRQRASA